MVDSCRGVAALATAVLVVEYGKVRDEFLGPADANDRRRERAAASGEQTESENEHDNTTELREELYWIGSDDC